MAFARMSSRCNLAAPNGLQDVKKGALISEDEHFPDIQQMTLPSLALLPALRPAGESTQASTFGKRSHRVSAEVFRLWSCFYSFLLRLFSPDYRISEKPVRVCVCAVRWPPVSPLSPFVRFLPVFLLLLRGCLFSNRANDVLRWALPSDSPR